MLDDTLVEINNSLAECIDVCIDNAFIANIGTVGGSVVYNKGTMSAAIIAEAMGSMRNGNQIKRKAYIPRACIYEPVCSLCALKEYQVLRNVLIAEMNELEHQLKDKQNVLSVKESLLMTLKRIQSGLEVGERTTRSKSQYILAIILKETENCMMNSEKTEVINVTSAGKPTLGLSFMKSMGKNIRQIPIMLTSDRIILSCWMLTVINSHKGHLNNLAYHTPILNGDFPWLSDRILRARCFDYSPSD